MDDRRRVRSELTIADRPAGSTLDQSFDYKRSAANGLDPVPSSACRPNSTARRELKALAVINFECILVDDLREYVRGGVEIVSRHMGLPRSKAAPRPQL